MASSRPRFYTVRSILDTIDCNESDVGDYNSDDSDEDASFASENDGPVAESDIEDDSDEEDTLPLANLVARSRAAPRRDGFRWRKKDFVPPSTDFTGPTAQAPIDAAIETPLQYFRRFITNDMLDSLVQNTNLYSVQKTGHSIQTNVKELEQVIGMYFHMGLVRMTSVRQYWETDCSYTPVSSVMSRNRFKNLLTKLHLIDNLSITDEDKKADKLWKIRPWLTSFRENCLQLIPAEIVSIDEMMCEYRGKTNPVQQYIKGKPHPWGFKIWGRADPSGILYDFDVYQGGTGERSELGLGADVILKLTSTLAYNVNYQVYADNFFTSMGLITALKERGMLYTGTVRKNRMGGCILAEEKDMKKSGRGTMDYRVEESNNVIAVRWYDNRAVSVLSSMTGVEPTQEARRWVKKDKDYNTFPMPAVIASYNQSMGGVDLLDSFAAAYRFKLRSRRWYMYLFWHILTLGLVNAWNVYRRDQTLLGLPKKEILSRRKFQASVASSLTLVNKERQRGRPSHEKPGKPPKKKMRPGPTPDVRYDTVGYWPAKVEQRGRFRYCDSKSSFTTTICTKCDIRLCFVDGRNCFMDFHVKK